MASTSGFRSSEACVLKSATGYARGYLLFLILLFLPSILFAQVYDNIGFRKDVPEEIRGQLVLCPIRVDNPPTISSK